MKNCPICNHYIIDPSGRTDSPILLIGEFPGEEEMKTGKPFVGPSGHILRREMARAGLDISRCRVTNLWLHPETKDGKCYEFMVDLIGQELNGKKAVLLIGSSAVSSMTAFGVTEVSGLEVEFVPPLDYFSGFVMAASTVSNTLGEFRVACVKFVKRIKEMELLL